jgi:murein DD-endopeptidase MepM/ murein hydrolase activator NlpD
MKSIKKITKLAAVVSNLGFKNEARLILKLSQEENFLSVDNKEESAKIASFPGKVINLDPGKTLIVRSNPTPLSSSLKKLNLNEEFDFLDEKAKFLSYDYLKIKSGATIGWILSPFAEYYNKDGVLVFRGERRKKPTDKKEEENKREEIKSSGVIMPIPNAKVVSSFGRRFHPIDKIWKMHDGIDISASEGTQLVAVENGKIIDIKPNNGGAGNTLYLEGSGGRVWLYMHLSSFVSKVGDIVNAGDEVAKSGNTGKSTGPHLHLALKINGNSVDPLTVLPWSGSDSDMVAKKTDSGSTDKKSKLPEDKKKFFYEQAVRVRQTYGVPEAVTLAQARLESKLGEKDINAFNFFGMKGVGTAGSVSAKTSEEYKSGEKSTITDSFQKYEKPEDSFDAYGKLLSSNDRYSYATTNFTDKPGRFAIWIWANGYATSSTYPMNLETVSKSNARDFGKSELEFSLSPEERAIAEKLSAMDPKERANAAKEMFGMKPPAIS